MLYVRSHPNSTASTTHKTLPRPSLLNQRRAFTKQEPIVSESNEMRPVKVGAQGRVATNIALLLRVTSSSELLINPFLAQLHSLFLGLLFAFEQLALDSLNLGNRSKLFTLINNTD